MVYYTHSQLDPKMGMYTNLLVVIQEACRFVVCMVGKGVITLFVDIMTYLSEVPLLCMCPL